MKKYFVHKLIKKKKNLQNYKTCEPTIMKYYRLKYSFYFKVIYKRPILVPG